MYLTISVGVTITYTLASLSIQSAAAATAVPAAAIFLSASSLSALATRQQSRLTTWAHPDICIYHRRCHPDLHLPSSEQ